MMGAMSLTIRPAGADDVPAALGLMESAARWLVARGRPGQWGTEPQATSPRRITAFTGWADDGALWVAEIDGVTVGALAVGRAPDHVPAATEPELYVNLLVTDRTHAGQGIGRALLDHARRLAEERGVGMLRVDCYAGDDRALVAYYEREGFRATTPFTVDNPTMWTKPWTAVINWKRSRGELHEYACHEGNYSLRGMLSAARGMFNALPLSPPRASLADCSSPRGRRIRAHRPSTPSS